MEWLQQVAIFTRQVKEKEAKDLLLFTLVYL